MPLERVMQRMKDKRKKKKAVKSGGGGRLHERARTLSKPMSFEADGGADSEVTLRRNRDAFQEIELHYNVLAGNEHDDIDLSARVLGRDPVAVS